ncbi:MAG: alpha/beta fold hydrolase [Acidimicrobiia bacterium]
MNEHKYRESEQLLWAWAGLEPTETWVTLSHTGTRVRIQEIGRGEPVLFIHGGPNAGATWAPMLKHFRGFRSLVVDRPGTGLSEPYPVTAANLASFGAGFVGAVLDGLGLEKAHVVASSFGGHLALRSAAAHPERFRKMVQMAAPAAAPGQSYPPFMKSLKSKLGRTMMNLFPPSRRINMNILRQIGHGASIDAGVIPEIFFDWYMDLARHTDTMRNDAEMIGAELLPKVEAVSLTWELLASVTTPTLFLWGADDGFGGEDHARDVAGHMPDAELVMIPKAGHLPWLDVPELAAAKTAEFLTGEARSGAGDASQEATP